MFKVVVIYDKEEKIYKATSYEVINANLIITKEDGSKLILPSEGISHIKVSSTSEETNE